MSSYRTVIWITWGIAVLLVIILALYPTWMTNYNKVMAKRRRVAGAAEGGTVMTMKRSDLFTNKLERRKIQKLIERREEKKRQWREAQQQQQQQENVLQVEENVIQEANQERSKITTPEEHGQELR